MPADCPATVLGVPDPLVGFIREVCHIPVDALAMAAPDALPEPARRLLVHLDDMTSTLASHHRSPLRVQVLRQRSVAGFYLREVFLRTKDTDLIVEYGVIAINLGRFTPPQQAAIEEGKLPLGALLHQFGTPFVSSPRGFFSLAAPELAATPLAAAGTGPGYGRFNRLALETGEDIAWILEILPSGVKIAFLTPGTGSYYCGACMRDNTLGRSLSRLGHDVTIVPMYLPLTLDDEAHPGLAGTPVFFGGINIYLQQKFAVFRRTPAILDRLLNTTGLLRWAARHSHMTSSRDHGELSLEMLNVGSSSLHKELDKLLDWFAGTVKPELVCLSNALLAGFAPVIRRRLGVPVVVFFQGEDLFLDGLPEPYRSRCWTVLKERLAESDLLVAPSRFYAEFMRARLGLGADDIAVVSNGISLDGLAPAVGVPAGPPVIGYLARLCREKGLEVFVNAFIHLACELGDREARATIAGAATAADERLIAELKQRLDQAGLAGRVTWTPNVTREGKIEFLRRLHLFTVPATYAEAFGLYVIEAMACGVPVVQPDAAAYSEIIAATGGGVCVKPGDAAALARGWQELLADSARRASLSRAGRAGVEKLFSDARMCEQFLEVAGRLPTSPVDPTP